MKSVVLLSLFLIGYTCGNDHLRSIDSITPEERCLAQGGTCTLAADCPKGQLTKEQGLCPKQRSLGVECCYGVSVKETRCQKRGGACLEGKNPCNPTYRFREATDCPDGHTCCIMV